MITLEGTQTGEETYKVTASPNHNAAVTFYVCRKPRIRGFVVCLNPDHPDNYFNAHPNFERAIRSANYRARRYVRAYSKPRGLVRAPGGGGWAA